MNNSPQTQVAYSRHFLPYFETGYMFDVPYAWVDVPSHLGDTVGYNRVMSDSSTLTADAFTVKSVKIGDTTLYDVKFLQKNGGSARVVSSIRLTELQIGLLYGKISTELQNNTQYPLDLVREAREKLKEE